VLVLVVAGLLFWAGATLLIDAWLRGRRRPDLMDHHAERMLTIASADPPAHECQCEGGEAPRL
jgi:hypothetical protein